LHHPPFLFADLPFFRSCLKEEIASAPSASRGRGDTRATGTLLTDPLEDEINVESVSRLLELLLAVNPQKDNIAKNEEIQDLFQQCNEMRPKVLELVVKFEKKKGICSSLVSTCFFFLWRSSTSPKSQRNFSSSTNSSSKQRPLMNGCWQPPSPHVRLFSKVIFFFLFLL